MSLFIPEKRPRSRARGEYRNTEANKLLDSLLGQPDTMPLEQVLEIVSDQTLCDNLVGLAAQTLVPLPHFLEVYQRQVGPL